VQLIGDLERAFAAAIYPNRLLIAAVGVVGIGLLIVVARRRRWHRVLRAHPRATLVAAIVAAATLAPSGWYLGSPLFLSSSIDDAPPVIAAITPTPTPSSSAAASPSSAIASPPATPLQLVNRAGAFRGADDFHFGKGTARLIETSPGVYTVRLEGFQVRNGPDLYVYLSPSRDGYAKGAIELGRLKADRGNQNYAVPATADVTVARSVVIWCKQFSVLFAVAELS
jgi:hypothetical protein